MVRCSFETVRITPDAYYIRDTGRHESQPTVTNDIEAVIDVLGPRLDGRRLYYYDSEGYLSEVLHDGGRFVDFRAGLR